MSYERLAKALLRGEVYFGAALQALQVPLERYAYLDAIVGQIRDPAMRALRLLEVGSWAGGSTITLGNALSRRVWSGTIECIDQWKPYFNLERDQGKLAYSEMNAAASDGTIYRLFLHNIAAAGIDRLVTVHRGASADILPGLPKEHFDLVFIDASHQYQDVLADISHTAPLLREGGILCGDDLEMQSHEVDPRELQEALAARTEYFARGEPVGYGYHPGVTAAVSATFGRASAWAAVWAMRKAGHGWERVALPDSEKIVVPPQFNADEIARERESAAEIQRMLDAAAPPSLQRQYAAIIAERDAANADLSALTKKYTAAAAELDAVYQSTSWKAVRLVQRLASAAPWLARLLRALALRGRKK